MKISEIKEKITPADKAVIIEIHKVSKEYVDKIIAGTRKHLLILETAAMVITGRLEFQDRLVKERGRELEKLMQSEALVYNHKGHKRTSPANHK